MKCGQRTLTILINVLLGDLFATGYDAAVYSAASSYLNQQAGNKTTVTGTWPYKKNTVGTAGANRPGGFKATPTSKTTQLHYCEVCKISCAGSQVCMV